MNAPANFASWAPRDGDTVHLNYLNRFGAPVGRYTLRALGPERWRLEGVTTPHRFIAVNATLQRAERETILTPISADELERERQQVALRAAAPLRAPRGRFIERQHDASDLALFRAANEPGLGL